MSKVCCLVVIFIILMMLGGGLLWGGIADRDSYDAAEGTLTQVWGCEPICRDYDVGGGGGGGGGEKRAVKTIECTGAAFTCNVEWRYDKNKFSDSGIDAAWEAKDVTCETIARGSAASIVIKKSDPSKAIDVLPPGQKRTSILLIVGAIMFTIALCFGVFTFIVFCCIIKESHPLFDRF